MPHKLIAFFNNLPILLFVIVAYILGGFGFGFVNFPTQTEASAWIMMQQVIIFNIYYFNIQVIQVTKV